MLAFSEEAQETQVFVNKVVVFHACGVEKPLCVFPLFPSFLYLYIYLSLLSHALYCSFYSNFNFFYKVGAGQKAAGDRGVFSGQNTNILWVLISLIWGGLLGIGVWDRLG